MSLRAFKNKIFNFKMLVGLFGILILMLFLTIRVKAEFFAFILPFCAGGILLYILVFGAIVLMNVNRSEALNDSDKENSQEK